MSPEQAQGHGVEQDLWTACGQREGDSCHGGGGFLLRGTGVASALIIISLAILRLCPLLRGHREGGVARRSSILRF